MIARAALAFASAVREVAYVVDPSLDLRIELVSGTESSLSLNSLLKSKVADQIATISLSAVVFATISWFGRTTLEYRYEKILDAVLAHEDAPTVSQAQVEAIVRKTVEAYRKQAAPRVGEVYRELDGDPSIAGVGATRTPGERPDNIIPRSEFADRAITGGDYYATAVVEDRRARRERTNVETLTLVSPVLLDSAKRKWRFLGKEGEFWAPIKDGLFLNNVLHGRTAIPMVAGIRLEVELQTVEDPAEDGAWEVRLRNVLRVRRIIPPPMQGRMDLSASYRQQPPDRNGKERKR